MLSNRLLKNHVILSDAQHREGSLFEILRLIFAFGRKHQAQNDGDGVFQPPAKRPSERPGGCSLSLFRLGEQGVTLLELILVIMVISIMASLAIPQWRISTDQKRADSAIATLRMISQCIKQYKIDLANDAIPNGTTYAALEDNGCLDRSLFEPSYDFPLATETINQVTIKAKDKKSTRMVCVQAAGTLQNLGAFYDYKQDLGGTCGSTPGLYRTFRIISTDAISGE